MILQQYPPSLDLEYCSFTAIFSSVNKELLYLVLKFSRLLYCTPVLYAAVSADLFLLLSDASFVFVFVVPVLMFFLFPCFGCLFGLYPILGTSPVYVPFRMLYSPSPLFSIVRLWFNCLIRDWTNNSIQRYFSNSKKERNTKVFRHKQQYQAHPSSLYGANHLPIVPFYLPSIQP